MNMLMRTMMRAGVFAAMALLAGCNGIGHGSTVQSLKVLFSPVDSRDQGVVIDNDLATRRLRMFDCFCANLAVLATFTDGTIANFSSRVHWTSSDPSIVTVSNFGDAIEAACPLAQSSAGLLRPHAPGQAVITAEFLGLSASLDVEVANAPASAFTLAPFDTGNTDHAVAVQGVMPLMLSVTLDGRPRPVNLDAKFAFNPAADNIATIGTFGTVAGHSPDGGTALTAQASFGSCSVVVTTPVRVGEVVGPMSIAEEPAFAAGAAADRNKLALSNNETLQVKAALAYGNNTSSAPVDLSAQSTADFTDPCTTRKYNADPAFAPSQCEPGSSSACPSSMPLCADATATACPSSLTAECRTVAAPMVSLATTRIIAATASTSPTTFFATFPILRGVDTTLSAAIGPSVSGLPDTVTVATLGGYPTVYPWEAQIETEVVQVFAATGTTLSVVRGYSGTSPVAHASGASFAQRKFGSSTVNVTSTAGALTQVTIDAYTPPALYATLQLGATGVYQDNSVVTVTQPVTHVSTFSASTPTLVWFSSKPVVATVGGDTGLVSPSSPCGGKVVIRARASTSTNTDDASFASTITTTDRDLNFNDDANDSACLGTDPLCDQVTLTIPRASPLPPGFTAAACDAL